MEETNLEKILKEINLEERSVLREEIAEAFNYIYKIHKKTLSYEDILLLIKYTAETVCNDLNKEKGDDASGNK